MTSLLRNRGVLIAAGAFALLLLLWIYRATRPVQIGEFTMPPLSGWTRTVKSTDRKQEVLYDKKDGSINFTLVFTERLDQDGSVPRNSQELVALMASKNSPEALSALQAFGMHMQVSPGQPKIQGGMPAVETQTLLTMSTQTTYGRSLDFVTASHLYGVYATVSVPPTSAPTPATYLAAERDEAFNTLLQSLNPSA